MRAVGRTINSSRSRAACRANCDTLRASIETRASPAPQAPATAPPAQRDRERTNGQPPSPRACHAVPPPLITVRLNHSCCACCVGPTGDCARTSLGKNSRNCACSSGASCARSQRAVRQAQTSCCRRLLPSQARGRLRRSLQRSQVDRSERGGDFSGSLSRGVRVCVGAARTRTSSRVRISSYCACAPLRSSFIDCAAHRRA